jgi:hypothetical protein
MVNFKIIEEVAQKMVEGRGAKEGSDWYHILYDPLVLFYILEETSKTTENETYIAELGDTLSLLKGIWDARKDCYKDMKWSGRESRRVLPEMLLMSKEEKAEFEKTFKELKESVYKIPKAVDEQKEEEVVKALYGIREKLAKYADINEDFVSRIYNLDNEEYVQVDPLLKKPSAVPTPDTVGYLAKKKPGKDDKDEK